MKNILESESIPNPHVMFMAIGDVNYDSAPLQVTQFEADIRIAEQLKDLYLEGGGGTNDSESYPLAWHFAANRTKLDSFDNRGEKAMLFTIGDEYAPKQISGDHLRRFLGEENAQDQMCSDMLAKAQEKYEVFHLGLKERKAFTQDVQSSWTKMLGQRLILVDDYKKVADIIVSTITMVLEQRQRQRQSQQESIRQHMASRVAVLSGNRAPGGAQISHELSADEPPTYLQATSPSFGGRRA